MMTNSKKGVELALDVIIIAVIGLLVLVIILYIFGGKANIFSKGVSQCESLGGQCSTNPCTGPVLTGGECPKQEGVTVYCCSKAVTS